MLKIQLTEYLGKNTFGNFDSLTAANVALKSIIKRAKWSNVAYLITLPNNATFEGYIDLEPYEFHSSHLSNIFSFHIKTVLTNISKLNPCWQATKQDIDFCKSLLNQLFNNG